MQAFSICSSVEQSAKDKYASKMFEAFVTQSYGKSTLAFFQFDLAKEEAVKAGENPLKIAAIENLFRWYRNYASSLNLYYEPPTGYDRIIGEYRPHNYVSNAPAKYQSEWGKSPEQARLVREFIFGVGEVVSAVFCTVVSSGAFAAISGGVGLDGVFRIFSSLNSIWTLHQTELYALQQWERNSLNPAIKN